MKSAPCKDFPVADSAYLYLKAPSGAQPPKKLHPLEGKLATQTIIPASWVQRPCMQAQETSRLFGNIVCRT